MPRRGRPRKPTAAHVLESTYRHDRHGQGAEWVPEGQPSPPDWLSADARQFWDVIVPQLIAKGVATLADEASLIGLCDWWAQYLAASRALRAIDYADTSAYRLLNQAAVAWKSFAGIASKFGLTPSDRAALRLPLEQPSNSIEGFARKR